MTLALRCSGDPTMKPYQSLHLSECLGHVGLERAVASQVPAPVLKGSARAGEEVVVVRLLLGKNPKPLNP